MPRPTARRPAPPTRRAGALALLIGCAPGSAADLAPDCVSCHAAEATEHAASAHGSPVTPLFEALRDALDDPGCDACHRPEGEASLTCLTCHAAVGHEGVANGRLLHQPWGPVQGVRDRDAPHAVRAGFPADAALCGTCHDSTLRPAFHEAPYAHWAEGPAAADGVRCQDCHLRATPGDPTSALSHRVIGLSHAEGLALLRGAVDLQRRGDQVTLTHAGTGHHLPDGASFLRDLRVVATVDGAPVPLPDAATLSARWTASGQPTGDPTVADGLRDGALAPGGQRTLTVPPTARVCLVLTRERPDLRRRLGLPVDAAAEAAVEVVCAAP